MSYIYSNNNSPSILTILNQSYINGTPIILYTYTSTPTSNSTWSYNPNDQLIVSSGNSDYCLNVSDPSQNNIPTQVSIISVSAATNNSKWQFNNDGTILNVGTNLFMNIGPNVGSGVGYPTITVGNNSNVTWSFPCSWVTSGNNVVCPTQPCGVMSCLIPILVTAGLLLLLFMIIFIVYHHVNRPKQLS